MTQDHRAQILWTAKDAAAATEGEARGDWTASGVSIDTRSLVPGDLFIALVGDRNDGHAHVAAAIAAGAAAAMVHATPPALPAGAPLLVVRDTFAGLHALGAQARSRTRARIAAVTGSVGKTGSKEMLRAALSALGPTSASAGNLNNHWGAPLSLARMDPTSGFGVFELGMNHAGEIGPLSRLVRPHAALITAIAPAHTAFFNSIEAVADAKAEIFEGVESGGAAVLPSDDAQMPRLEAAARATGLRRILHFGQEPGDDVRLLSLSLDAGGCDVEAEAAGHRLHWRVGAAGRHWARNSLGVVATLLALGIGTRGDLATATAALANVHAPAGRGARRQIALATGGAFDLIDESYNASPAAVHAALDVLAMLRPEGRRIVVLGDMLELGADGPAEHRALAEAVEAAGADIAFTCGPESRATHDSLPPALRGGWAASSAEIAPRVAEAVAAGDIVLVKGSLGMDMARIVRALDGLGTPPRAAANGGR